MVDIQSKEVIDKISDELKVQPAMQIPRVLGKDIQLVYKVNPQKISSIVRAAPIAAGATTVIFATPSDRKFYLTNVSLQVHAKSPAAAGNSSITLDIDGATQTILKIRAQSAVDTFHSLVFNLPFPILVDAGTNISLVSSAAELQTEGTIVGYVTDPQ